MANNVGAWPIDPATETGLFRTELGDVAGTPADPATTPQTAEFEFISDAAIAALIVAYPSSPDLAMSSAMSSMAVQMIASAQDIQVDDIRIKTVERARLMMDFASRLAAGSSLIEADSAFSIVALKTTSGGGSHRYGRTQGTPYPVM
jgi:hypothetical protein